MGERSRHVSALEKNHCEQICKLSSKMHGREFLQVGRSFFLKPPSGLTTPTHNIAFTSRFRLTLGKAERH